jgi:hypothetical protein
MRFPRAKRMPKIRVADVISFLMIQLNFRPLDAWPRSVVFQASSSSPNASVPWIASERPGRTLDALRDWSGVGSVAFTWAYRWATGGIASPIWRAVANFFIWPMRHLFPGDVLAFNQPTSVARAIPATGGMR